MPSDMDDFKGRRALVVEDDPNDNVLIQAALSNLHLDFETAGSVDEADSRIHRFLPHLVILDVGIPKSWDIPQPVPFPDILGLIKKFQTEHAVVLITGSVDWDHVQRAMAAGACDYLDKKILDNREYFESRITMALQLHRARVEKNALATIMDMQANIRASIETMRTTLLEEIHRTLKTSQRTDAKVGTTQDKKDELWKKQITERVTQEVTEAVNAKWRKWLFSAGATFMWGVIFAAKHFFWDRYFGKKD